MFFDLSGIPTPLAIYPLNRDTKGSDVSPNKNPPGSPTGVRYAPGTNGIPDKSTSFFGKPGSFVEFPISKKLDAKDAITILFNVYPEKAGPIVEYYPGGIQVWVVAPDTIFVRLVRRVGKTTRRLVAKKLKPRRWNYVGVTYDQKRGKTTKNHHFHFVQL